MARLKSARVAALAIAAVATASSASAVPRSNRAEVLAVRPPMVGRCAVFPVDNAWNTDITNAPVRSNSAEYIAAINASGETVLHPDFGGNGEYGIPFVNVARGTVPQRINYTAYGDESDSGPFPIPPTTPVEGGTQSDGDRHVIAVEQGTCRLFELYRAFWRPGRHRWDAASGATWDLSSNALRPLGWTSADAAGLPILPGLVRYREVANGEIRHALRFTVSRTQRGYVLPATHAASSSSDASLPPMGLRFRLKAGFDTSHFHGQALVILRALKRYGMIVADNGSNWYITGAVDPEWDDDDLHQLARVPGTAFEVVNTGRIRH